MMYIAVTRKKYKDTYHEQILLRESYREDGKVKTRTLLNLTNQPKEQVQAIAAALKNKSDIVITADNQSQGRTVGLTLCDCVSYEYAWYASRVFGRTFEAKLH
ncbi:MAG: hypothetical protein Q9M40_07630 [Sulfurimonas sp.]|nr:hypothetical protein [Sulfurimonas sp.]